MIALPLALATVLAPPPPRDARRVAAVGCQTVGDRSLCPPADVSDPKYHGAAEAAFQNRVEAAREALKAGATATRPGASDLPVPPSGG